MNRQFEIQGENNAQPRTGRLETGDDNHRHGKLPSSLARRIAAASMSMMTALGCSSRGGEITYADSGGEAKSEVSPADAGSTETSLADAWSGLVDTGRGSTGSTDSSNTGSSNPDVYIPGVSAAADTSGQTGSDVVKPAYDVPSVVKQDIQQTVKCPEGGVPQAVFLGSNKPFAVTTSFTGSKEILSATLLADNTKNDKGQTISAGQVAKFSPTDLGKGTAVIQSVHVDGSAGTNGFVVAQKPNTAGTTRADSCVVVSRLEGTAGFANKGNLTQLLDGLSPGVAAIATDLNSKHDAGTKDGCDQIIAKTQMAFDQFFGPKGLAIKVDIKSSNFAPGMFKKPSGEVVPDSDLQPHPQGTVKGQGDAWMQIKHVNIPQSACAKGVEWKN